MAETVIVDERVTEGALEKESVTIRELVAGVVVEDQDGFSKAGDLAKQVKAFQKKVEDYWEPIRDSAYKAYKTINDRKKQMLDPLKDAEKSLKQKMGAYTMEVERKRREEEERLRKIAEEEQRRRLEEAQRLEEERKQKIAEAQTHEEDGNDFFAALAHMEAQKAEKAAQAAVAEAQMMASVPVSVQVEKPQMKGVSQRVAWEIVSVDESKVPVSVAGAVIRPVDQAAVMRLIKASNGTVEIPGVEYRKTVNMVIRG